LFRIDLLSRIPVSEQVIENLAGLIRSGAIPCGEKLPSVRELSHQLTVSPTTVMKAFHALEEQGLIVPSSGLGAYVAPREAWHARRAKSLHTNEPDCAAALREAAERCAKEGHPLSAAMELLREAYRGARVS